jgi:hypothetical protein
MRPAEQHAFAQLLGHAGGVAHAGALAGDEELLAAPAPEHVAGAQVARDDGGDATQHLVPAVMAVAVVDMLEVVDVQHHQGHALRGGLEVVQ